MIQTIVFVTIISIAVFAIKIMKVPELKNRGKITPKQLVTLNLMHLMS